MRICSGGLDSLEVEKKRFLPEFNVPEDRGITLVYIVRAAREGLARDWNRAQIALVNRPQECSHCKKSFVATANQL